VYAIYYRGSFVPYQPVRSEDFTQPIYVGKAEPAGGRKGTQTGAATGGAELYGRLSEHAISIEAVQNLNLDDFVCRHLVVIPLWIRIVERFLIEEFRPIWNGCLDGFGIHDPGGRRSPIISWWDAMHPGRPEALNWKAAFRRTRTLEDASRRVDQWLVEPVRPVFIEED
jgi:hypothetical protein